ncbi:MAG: hypothetical protein WB679_26800 [Terracidiphilus sp.]
MSVKLNSVEEIAAEIRESLSKAYKEIANWDVQEPEREEVELAKYFVERAFIQSLTFLEAAGLNQTFSALAAINEAAKENYAEYSVFSEGAYLVWAAKLEAYLKGIETIFVGSQSGRVTKELIDILRATQYSITDRNCFSSVLQNEDHVHSRIEAVLRCVFTDLRHKPPIAKPIKNFEPDTGIPSLKTLIEYKYVESLQDVKRVVDEVLADTRGYSSKSWERFIYVIYETTRLKPESEWRQMLRENDVPENTDVVVISGEARDPNAVPTGRVQSKKVASARLRSAKKLPSTRAAPR